MKLLIVSATPAEIEPLTRFLAEREDLQEGVNVVISGVGMVATAFSMGTELALARYDLAVNAGIAGAFDKSLPLGTVLQVKEDCFSELGAEDDTAFITLDDLGFGKSTERPLAFGLSEGRLSSLPEVSAITVNRVHGWETSIRSIKERLKPDIESMEGAAFFYSCRVKGVPSLQLRAVSNYVERRNRAAWNIPLAIRNLNEELIELLKRML